MAGRETQRADASSHTRSFTGCATCRSRHVKCDEGRPTCAMCTYFGLSCAGYKKDIFFDSKNPDSRLRFRRPLLTEAERIRMTEWLVSVAPAHLTNRILARIDDEGDEVLPDADLSLQVGPFGVFKVQQGRLPSPIIPIEDDSEENLANSPSPGPIETENVAPMEHAFSAELLDLTDTLFDPLGQSSSPSVPDLIDLIMSPDRLVNGPPSPQDYGTTSLLTDSSINPQHFDSSLANPSLLTTPTSCKSIPQDTIFLLKHYSSTVISLMTPVRHTKTPWHILFIPHVKNCLAAFALGDHLNHASLCVFYGTLAISAFSLGGVSRSDNWLDQGRAYLQQAEVHAKAMLFTAYDIPKSAKYKSILMALLTMIQVSNFSGNRNQAEEYFLEAEKLIRVKGLRRRKSRKVRLLHHCYVFERMFHESIFINGANSIHRIKVRKAIESSGLARCSVDGLSFRLSNWKNLQQEMLRVRDREEGENDLHLELPGLFSATLYPEIFGIPESWIQLLSLVIRLGTEKDTAEEAHPSTLALKDFIKRSKALEDYINQLQKPSEMTFSLGTHQSSTDQQILGSMLEAMRNALAIYFYRRIYDLDSSLLQEKVTNIRDCLLQCEYTDSSVVHGSAGFIWPAFIAACEAEDSKLQESFATWFEISARRSGLACFEHTLTSIQIVWKEKKRSNGGSVTWLDLMRNS